MYASMKRSQFPPLSKKYRDLSEYLEVLRPVFQSFFFGELRIEWKLNSDHHFSIHGFIPNDPTPVTSCEIMQYNGVCMCTPGVRPLNKVSLMLTESQKGHILDIMFMRLLREQGAQLRNCFSFLVTVKDSFAARFNDTKRYKDACDISLAVTDIALNIEYNECTHLVRYAESLGANGKYMEAASIYSWLAEGDKFPLDTEHDLSDAKLYGYAGLAFKRGKDYISAEKTYVAAFRAMVRNWHWNKDPGAKIHLGNMLSGDRSM